MDGESQKSADSGSMDRSLLGKDWGNVSSNLIGEAKDEKMFVDAATYGRRHVALNPDTKKPPIGQIDTRLIRHQITRKSKSEAEFLSLDGLKSMMPKSHHNQQLYWRKNVHAFAGQHLGVIREDKADKRRTKN